MDYENKYEQSLERARIAYKDEDKHLKATLKRIFPELKESEDERIRKKIIATIHLYYGEPLEDEAKEMIDWLEKQGKYNIGISEATKQKLEDNLNKALEKETPESWNEFLEKQGEQKPADYENPNIQQNDFAPKSAMEAIKEEKVDNANKVEQKFKEGDWVVYQNQTFQVTKNSGNNLILQGRRYQTYFIEELCKPWTIDDAKDGDVLHSPCCKLLWVYKDEKTCYVGSNLNYNSGSIVINKPICIPTDVHPATKEQRDLLFQKLCEAGYEWDAEKKELKKIEHNPAEWSEMDEEYLNNAIYACLNQYGNISVTAIWLKSLKDRVQPKSVEWSEEDERIYQSIMDDTVQENQLNDKQTNWLRDIKYRYFPQSQNTWKPSEEQMKVLNEVLNFAANHESSHWNDYIFGTLNNLIRQLKKLREELL